MKKTQLINKCKEIRDKYNIKQIISEEDQNRNINSIPHFGAAVVSPKCENYTGAGKFFLCRKCMARTSLLKPAASMAATARKFSN